MRGKKTGALPCWIRDGATVRVASQRSIRRHRQAKDPLELHLFNKKNEFSRVKF